MFNATYPDWAHQDYNEFSEFVRSMGDKIKFTIDEFCIIPKKGRLEKLMRTKENALDSYFFLKAIGHTDKNYENFLKICGYIED